MKGDTGGILFLSLPVNFWLRSAPPTNSNNFANVNSNGNVNTNNNNATNSNGVVPRFS